MPCPVELLFLLRGRLRRWDDFYRCCLRPLLRLLDCYELPSSRIPTTLVYHAASPMADRHMATSSNIVQSYRSARSGGLAWLGANSAFLKSQKRFR